MGAVDDLRQHRRDIHALRTKLTSVAPEGHAKMKKDDVKQGLGSMVSVDHHEHDIDPFHAPDPVAKEQKSFKELAETIEMEIKEIEDVFRVWMRHSDKTETIYKKQLQRLVEDLCPTRTIVDNDLDAWWDQIHHKGFAECLKVDWTMADDRYRDWSKATLDAEGQHSLSLARKSPASFDQFIMWWFACEVRQP